MKCADPQLCYVNSKGFKVYRNFSYASHIFKQMANQVFDCRKCIFCRKKHAYELASRCVLHASLYKDNCFVTLTYDEKKPGYHNNFNYEDIQKFKKRLRTHCQRHHNGKKIEIFNVHEYGSRGKKHWHLIIFNHDFGDKILFGGRSDLPLYTSAMLERLWPHGFNTIGDVSAASAMYQAQYVEKDFKNNNVTSKKKSHSKHSGIGRPYFLKHYKQILRLGYIPINGKKLPVPRSFQRIAHKHWCHYHEPSAFFDNSERKALYRPFIKTDPNPEIAQLYVEYKLIKEERKKELEQEWASFISEHLTSNQEPDFIKSESNTLHDLNKKQLGDIF